MKLFILMSLLISATSFGAEIIKHQNCEINSIRSWHREGLDILDPSTGILDLIHEKGWTLNLHRRTEGVHLTYEAWTGEKYIRHEGFGRAVNAYLRVTQPLANLVNTLELKLVEYQSYECTRGPGEHCIFPYHTTRHLVTKKKFRRNSLAKNEAFVKRFFQRLPECVIE